MLTDTVSINDILGRFSVVSAHVSLLERANVSDARPLARLTSKKQHHSAAQLLCFIYLFRGLFFCFANMLRKVDTQVISTSIISRKCLFSAQVLAMSPLFANEGIS